jgi:signal transduction histidine kinase
LVHVYPVSLAEQRLDSADFPRLAAARLGLVGDSGHVDAPGVEALAAEQERLRQVIHDLRNPVASVSMGIELLRGPYAPLLEQLPSEERARIQLTLEALHESARQLRYLVTDASLAHAQAGGPGANDVPANVVTKATSLKVVAEAAAVDAPAPSTRTFSPQKPARPSTRQSSSIRTSAVRLEEVVRRLEVLTVTRSSLPVLLSVQIESGLTVQANGSELLRALANIVENAAEASALAFPDLSPWTIEIGARKRGSHAEIEVRNRGRGFLPGVLEWLQDPQPREAHPPSHKTDGAMHGLGLGGARRLAASLGGALEAESRGEWTIVRMTLPTSALRKVANAAVSESDF